MDNEKIKEKIRKVLRSEIKSFAEGKKDRIGFPKDLSEEIEEMKETKVWIADMKEETFWKVVKKLEEEGRERREKDNAMYPMEYKVVERDIFNHEDLKDTKVYLYLSVFDGFLVFRHLNIFLIDDYTEKFDVFWYHPDHHIRPITHKAMHWEDGELEYDIIETEGGEIPYLILCSKEERVVYWVKMAKEGYDLVRNMEYRDVGWVFDNSNHDLDLFR